MVIYLSREWRELCSIILKALFSIRNVAQESFCSYKFVNERVEQKNNVYCAGLVSYLTQLIIFGATDDKLKKNERIITTKRYL